VRLLAISSATTWARGWPSQWTRSAPASTLFLTENLWGVGSTAPYLHDGRATTLTEASSSTAVEAKASRDAFVALSTSSKTDVITFLNNLVLFVIPRRSNRMRKYGLHLGVVAGVLLAATLGAVGGAHWAGRASRGPARPTTARPWARRRSPRAGRARGG
jgi:hypothetical protein